MGATVPITTWSLSCVERAFARVDGVADGSADLADAAKRRRRRHRQRAARLWWLKGVTAYVIASAAAGRCGGPERARSVAPSRQAAAAVVWAALRRVYGRA